MGVEVVFNILSLFVFGVQSSNPACNSEVFCSGPLLDAAQDAFIYNDSKSFVDMKLNNDSDIVLQAFVELNSTLGGNITDNVMKDFVDQHFSPPGSEFVNWTPADWKESPAVLDKIEDEQLRLWAIELHDLWKELGREMIKEVATNAHLYSLIPVENPVIVPGGRFRELYYWDTYWVIRGLLLSEMADTVKGILQNLLDLVETYGFVPNGARIYYSKRSQPPFLIPMVHEYVKATGDFEFLRQALPTLDKEYTFWIDERSVTVDKLGESYKLNRYASDVNEPRPESYREDKEVIKDLSTDDGRTLMTHITSACESGWDFSTRWAGPDFDANRDVIGQLRTRDVIPVDLNSVLALCERIMAYYHSAEGDTEKVQYYEGQYSNRVAAIEAVLWSETEGAYFDHSIQTGEMNKNYYASNVNPLWTRCFPDSVNADEREMRLYQYLKGAGVLDFPGGIPTSLNDSKQQWDFPNAWPPLVHMMIEGLADSTSQLLRDEALLQAQKWVQGNYRVYEKTNFMFEKYDVTQDDPEPGAGGEYDVQKGFGWTNGVVLTLLDRYGSHLKANPSSTTACIVTTPLSEKTTSSGKPLSSGLLKKPLFVLGAIIGVALSLF